MSCSRFVQFVNLFITYVNVYDRNRNRVLFMSSSVFFRFSLELVVTSFCPWPHLTSTSDCISGLLQVCEMHVAGYEFSVLDNAFLLHKGFKTQDGFHETKDEEQNRNRLLFRKFKEELKTKYPESSRRCWQSVRAVPWCVQGYRDIE